MFAATRVTRTAAAGSNIQVPRALNADVTHYMTSFHTSIYRMYQSPSLFKYAYDIMAQVGFRLDTIFSAPYLEQIVNFARNKIPRDVAVYHLRHEYNAGTFATNSMETLKPHLEVVQHELQLQHPDIYNTINNYSTQFYNTSAFTSAPTFPNVPAAPAIPDVHPIQSVPAQSVTPDMLQQVNLIPVAPAVPPINAIPAGPAPMPVFPPAAPVVPPIHAIPAGPAPMPFFPPAAPAVPPIHPLQSIPAQSVTQDMILQSRLVHIEPALPAVVNFNYLFGMFFQALVFGFIFYIVATAGTTSYVQYQLSKSNFNNVFPGLPCEKEVDSFITGFNNLITNPTKHSVVDFFTNIPRLCSKQFNADFSYINKIFNGHLPELHPHKLVAVHSNWDLVYIFLYIFSVMLFWILLILFLYYLIKFLWRC